jgi:hypothetical protein
VFNVSINPYRKFVLSDYIERSDNTDYSWRINTINIVTYGCENAW